MQSGKKSDEWKVGQSKMSDDRERLKVGNIRSLYRMGGQMEG